MVTKYINFFDLKRNPHLLVFYGDKPMLKKILLTCSALILATVLGSIGYTETFSGGDLVGIWDGHQLVSGDAPVDDPRWGYGTVVVNSSGNFTMTWNSPSAGNEASTGTIQIDGNGIVRLNDAPLIHGVMDADKNQIVFIDGISGSKGNGQLILIKRYFKFMPCIPLQFLDE